MKFRDFLLENRIPLASFAKRAKISRPTAKKAFDGMSISFNSAEKIQEATKGKVSALELLPPKEDKPEHHQKEAHKT